MSPPFLHFCRFSFFLTPAFPTRPLTPLGLEPTEDVLLFVLNPLFDRSDSFQVPFVLQSCQGLRLMRAVRTLLPPPLLKHSNPSFGDPLFFSPSRGVAPNIRQPALLSCAFSPLVRFAPQFPASVFIIPYIVHPQAFSRVRGPASPPPPLLRRFLGTFHPSPFPTVSPPLSTQLYNPQMPHTTKKVCNPPLLPPKKLSRFSFPSFPPSFSSFFESPFRITLNIVLC